MVTGHQNTTPTVVIQNQRRNITEWLISVSQSKVSGQSRSNACTIIVVLVTINFFIANQLVSFLPTTPFTSMVCKHVQADDATRKQSSSVVRTCSPKLQYPSTTLADFIGVARCGDEYQFHSFQQFRHS